MRNLKKYMNNFLYYQETGLGKSVNTIKSYRNDILRFIIYIYEYEEITDFKDVKKMTFRSFMAYLNKEGLAKRSINRSLSAIRSFFEYLVSEEIIKNNMSNYVNNPKFEEKLPTVLTPKEVKKFSDVIDTSKITGIRDRTVVELLYSSGIRVSELISLSEYLIDFDQRELRVVGKGEKERITFFSKTAREWMKKYINAKKKKYKNYTPDILFVNSRGNKITSRSIRRKMGKYSKKANLGKKVTPHTFRHSFATYLLNHDLDIKYVQDLLGHETLMTTQVYTKVSKKHLRDVYLKTHPFSTED
ncbi:MAG: site-specific tyrosine recombinase/integron integrase [Fusobacteriota bacterium]